MNLDNAIKVAGLIKQGLAVRAGGPGSGRHKELDAIEQHLLSKGFKLDKAATTDDGRSKTYHHPDQELAKEIKEHIKSAHGLVNDDVDKSGKPRKYGPSGNQHENFNKPGESGGDFVQVAKYKDGGGGSRRGTSVSLNHGWKDVDASEIKAGGPGSGRRPGDGVSKIGEVAHTRLAHQEAAEHHRKEGDRLINRDRQAALKHYDASQWHRDTIRDRNIDPSFSKEANRRSKIANEFVSPQEHLLAGGPGSGKKPECTFKPDPKFMGGKVCKNCGKTDTHPNHTGKYLEAGGPGSGRKPGFGTAHAPEKLNQMHDKLDKAGFKYTHTVDTIAKRKSQDEEKRPVAIHYYKHDNGREALIEEHKNGTNHTMTRFTPKD